MTNAQFILALIGGMAAFLGGTWIIAQAIQKTASNPLYDERFENTKASMEEMKESICTLFDRVDEMPNKIIEILRNTGVIKRGVNS